MGHLDETAFTAAIAGCVACGANSFEIASYLDRQVSVMLGEANDDGRWTHDGEKFIDGTYRVTCVGCDRDAYASLDCPRCHRVGCLADIVDAPSRLAVPRRCPSCRGTEVTVIGFAPARVRTGAGRPSAPAPIALLGDAGFHIAAIACDQCEWVQSADGCPLCGGPGPLRDRP